MLKRSEKNPILSPNPKVAWESRAAFNPCIAKDNQFFHLFYRAVGKAPADHPAPTMSTIAHALSSNGLDFTDREQFIKPTETWERFGCEDPRVTFIDDKYYIFYTALADYPFQASGIRVGLAITKDFKTIQEKHLITPFNAKAMALFPERINGKLVAILTVSTDLPPAKIAIASFNNESDMWSEAFWTLWYQSLEHHVIPLLRSRRDHLEVGAAPLKTEKGWLLLYSYIQNYFSNAKIFTIEAVLLDLLEPRQIVSTDTKPLLLPETDYERKGEVPNIAFPSGAYIEQDNLHLYYGAADTTCCRATCSVSDLLENLTRDKPNSFEFEEENAQGFKRFVGNPIIRPRLELDWESIATLNPAAIYLDGHFHIVYRALGHDWTSVLGYARSQDGCRIDERLSIPIYQPRAEFEQKLRAGYSGCEDPRLTILDDMVYMFYTAYDGYTPRVTFSSITVADFLNKNWNWTFPSVLTPPGTDDKNSCLFPKKINNQFVVLHRRQHAICINFVDDLHCVPNQWLSDQTHLIQRKSDYFYNLKFGISAPPIETPHGWIVLYHRVTMNDHVYKIGAMLLDLDDPRRIICMTDKTLLEPIKEYERHGLVPNVVFPCGAVLLEGCIYLYYGCSDTVVGVAKMELKRLLALLGVS